MLEFIIIGVILIFIMAYRSSNGDGIYNFARKQATVVYDKYAPYTCEFSDCICMASFKQSIKVSSI